MRYSLEEFLKFNKEETNDAGWQNGPVAGICLMCCEPFDVEAESLNPRRIYQVVGNPGRAISSSSGNMDLELEDECMPLCPECFDGAAMLAEAAEELSAFDCPQYLKIVSVQQNANLPVSDNPTEPNPTKQSMTITNGNSREENQISIDVPLPQECLSTSKIPHPTFKNAEPPREIKVISENETLFVYSKDFELRRWYENSNLEKDSSPMEVEPLPSTSRAFIPRFILEENIKDSSATNLREDKKSPAAEIAPLTESLSSDKESASGAPLPANNQATVTLTASRFKDRTKIIIKGDMSATNSKNTSSRKSMKTIYRRREGSSSSTCQNQDSDVNSLQNLLGHKTIHTRETETLNAATDEFPEVQTSSSNSSGVRRRLRPKSRGLKKIFSLTSLTKNKQKPKCSICKKQFASNRNVKRHIREVHGRVSNGKCTNAKTNVYPNLKPECSICGKQYFGTSNVTRHIREVHKITEYNKKKSASIIQMSTPKKSPNTSTHNIHEKGKQQCPICGQQYSYKSGVKRHITKVHLEFHKL